MALPVTKDNEENWTTLDLEYPDGGIVTFALEPQSQESAAALHEVEFELKYGEPGDKEK